MLDRITATFDTLYSPTALAVDRQPPAPTRAFFAYFLRQFRVAHPAKCHRVDQIHITVHERAEGCFRIPLNVTLQ